MLRHPPGPFFRCEPCRTVEPTSITAGDSLEWTRQPAGDPADGWTLDYVLTSGPGAEPIVFPAADVDGVWAITVSDAVTAAILPGSYRLLGYERKPSGLRRLVYEGRLEVAPDPFGPVVLSPTRAVLDRLYAQRDELLEGATEEYSINGRSVKKRQLAEVERMIAKYESRLAAEEGRAPVFRTVAVTFGSAR
jgi:hypothetical protein